MLFADVLVLALAEEYLLPQGDVVLPATHLLFEHICPEGQASGEFTHAGHPLSLVPHTFPVFPSQILSPGLHTKFSVHAFELLHCPLEHVFPEGQ